jgi:hypothetical protein
MGRRPLDLLDGGLIERCRQMRLASARFTASSSFCISAMRLRRSAAFCTRRRSMATTDCLMDDQRLDLHSVPLQECPFPHSGSFFPVTRCASWATPTSASNGQCVLECRRKLREAGWDEATASETRSELERPEQKLREIDDEGRLGLRPLSTRSHACSGEVRPHIGAALAAGLADKPRLDIG